MSDLNTSGGDGPRRGGRRQAQSQEGGVGHLVQHIAHHRYSQDGEGQSSTNGESKSGGNYQFHRRMSARKKKPTIMNDFVTLDETGEFRIRISPNQEKKKRRGKIIFDSNKSGAREDIQVGGEQSGGDHGVEADRPTDCRDADPASVGRGGNDRSYSLDMGRDSPNRDPVNGEYVSTVVDRTLGDVTLERRERLTAIDVFIEEIRNGNGEANDNNQTNEIRMQVQTNNPDPVTTNSQVYQASQGTGEDNDEEFLNLNDRVNPTVPPADLSVVRARDSDGWTLIRRVGGWESLLCEFQMLEEVPDEHQQVWVLAWTHVLKNLDMAESEEETDMALMWMMFLPQSLLRRPHRGGKAGRGLVALRFNALARGDWGFLVETYEEDLSKLRLLRSQRRVRREESEMEHLARLKRQSEVFIAGGQISKATKRIVSNGVADISNPEVLNQLRAKYPPRLRPLPDKVIRGDPIPSLGGLREALSSLKDGIAPGSGGLRSEYLSLLGVEMNNHGMDLMEKFGMKYLRAQLPPWFYVVWLTVQTVPLFKSSDKDAVRPLGLRNNLVKSLHREVTKGNREVVRSYLEPQQLVLSTAGASKLIFSVRELLETRRDFVCLKLDIKNAYNETSRAETIKVLSEEPRLQHLASFAAATLAPAFGLEAGGIVWGKTEEGGTQGDPKTGDLFSVTFQPSVVLLDNACRVGGGAARAGADDVFAIGLPEVVIPAGVEFAREVYDRCGLVLEWSKTELFSWEDDLPEYCPSGVTLAGRQIGESFSRGFLCWGAPVGEDDYVSDVLEEKARSIVDEGRRVVEVLGQGQSAWAALKWSVWPRFDYWLALCYPSHTRPVASWLDGELWELLQAVSGIDIPSTSTRRNYPECSLRVPVSGRDGWSFSAWVVRQPVRLGGLGLRSLKEQCYPAFVGAVEQSLPHMYGENGVCPPLEDVVGGQDCFGEDTDSNGRWRVLIASQSRVGREFQASWSAMQIEAQEAADWLDSEIEGPLINSVDSAGGDSTSGLTRHLLTEKREIMLGHLLDKVLDDHDDQSLRPVWSWPERDKLSSHWVLALPRDDSRLTNGEFAECMAKMLCLPSPACLSKLGEKIGRRTVDLFGDTVMAEKVVGDGWRRRHDSMKMRIFSLLRWAGLNAQTEVFNLFSGDIPQEGLSRLDRGRKRQGMVPDFRVSLPNGESVATGNRVELAELKVISSCPSRYQRNPRAPTKAVDRRASTLNREYLSHAKTLDRVYGRVPDDVVGPVQRKLETFPPVQGWVFGAWGEASSDVHSLVHILATSRLRYQNELRGNHRMAGRSDKGELAILTGQIRRILSVEAVRAQARCLLDRVEGIGAAANAAAKRRSFAMLEERTMRRERRAHLVSLSQGRPIIRRGQFFLS